MTQEMKIQKINSNIRIQKSAYKMADARSKAFIAGEIKDNKTTEEWKVYRTTKSELSNVIDKELKKLISQTKKECYGEMMEMIKDTEIRRIEIDNDGEKCDINEIYNGGYSTALDILKHKLNKKEANETTNL